MLWLLGCLLCLALPGRGEAAPDFQQRYAQGRLLLKQKLYGDAIRELRQALRTPHGARHFGVHYHLAVAYYYVGNLRQAVRTLKQARALASQESHRQAHKLLSERIGTLFGAVRIQTRASLETLGRVRLKLKATQPFVHPDKQRIYRTLRKQWASQGVVIDGHPHYLPQGTYRVELLRPQCLAWSLVQANASESAPLSTLTVQGPLRLSLAERPSCQCGGGRVVHRERQRLSCVCPKGTLWSDAKKRCLSTGVARATRGPSPWIWVGVVGAAVVAGGAVAIYFATTEAQRETDTARISGRLWRGAQR